MSSKLVVPVALGLSLVTVTALVVYYVFKKEEDDNGGEVTTTRPKAITVKVPKSLTPVVLGRGGSTIKHIEQTTGANLKFERFTEGDHDICRIWGRSDDIQLAETMVHEYIRNQPEITSETMTVPGWSCGRILGRNGVNIQDISLQSGARVKVDNKTQDRNVDRNISIKGTKEQIQKAKELIENQVAQERCRREIEQSRSPRVSRASPGRESPESQSPGDARSHAKFKRAEKVVPTIEVYVSAVSSPSRFWVQFVGAQVAQLDELVTQMTEYYGKKENREAHALEHVSVGQVVAAVFRHDGRWYRARVHGIIPNEFDPTQLVADLFFLDYGDSEYVPVLELCELKSDLLRLRFQAMECFLAGVRPAGGAPDSEGQWSSKAIERFEELAKVATWKSVVSKTCTYKKTVSAESGKEKEIPGIKLFDETDEGMLDIGDVLIEEGWAVAGAPGEHPPAPHAPHSAPFGDLGTSRVLGMLDPNSRSSSLPKDHKDTEDSENNAQNETKGKENDLLAGAKSLSSGLDKDKVLSISNFDLTYSDKPKPQVNGSHDDFLNSERLIVDKESSSETLTPDHVPSAIPPEFKANMNRIDSHHSNLETLGRSTYDLQN